MDQLLNSLGSIPNIGNDLGGTDMNDIPTDTDLTRSVESALNNGGISTDQNRTVEARVARCKEKQVELESKFAKLQRRINALRSFHVGNHAAKQIQLGVMCCERKVVRTKPSQQSEDSSNVSEKKRSEISTATDTLQIVENKVRSRDVTSKLRDVTSEQADQTFGQLYTHIRHVQKFADPDATESSSGGESADEHDKYPPGATFYAPIRERAKYRWLKKRSEYAAQWGWIQSQISDLEFKIRQQTDMYKAYRKAKGAVNLEDPHHSPTKRRVESVYAVSSDEESSLTCSRIRPVTRFKRRKLLDTYALHHVNPKLNKQSNVNCSCLLADEWCVLCLGRRHARLQPDIHTQSRVECTALLDHSYHSVLSTPDCVPVSAILTQAAFNKRWVNVSGSGNGSTSIPLHLSKLTDVNEKVPDPISDLSGLVPGERKRKRRTKRKKDDLIGGIVPGRKRRLRMSSSGSIQREYFDALTNTVVKEIREIKDAKEMARIKDVSSFQDVGRRRRKNSFDIDHVVIPYNMTAPRQKKPKYKEILTPSWRDGYETYPWPPMGSVKRATGARRPTPPPKPTTGDSDYEDISELAISILHAKAEEDERIRWATPLGRVPGGQRTRANRMRRLDSCITEASSGLNTPDPLSPGFIDRVEDIMVQTRPSSPQDDGAVTPMLVSPAGSSQAGDQSHQNLEPSGSSSSTWDSADVVPGSLRGARRRTSSQTFRSHRNRNLSEASQGSSRCASPGFTGSQVPGVTTSLGITASYGPGVTTSLGSDIVTAQSVDGSGLSANASQSAETTGNLQVNVEESPQVGDIGAPQTQAGPHFGLNHIAGLPKAVVFVNHFVKRQFPLSDEELKILEEEDGKMMHPPPPRTPAAISSRASVSPTPPVGVTTVSASSTLGANSGAMGTYSGTLGANSGPLGASSGSLATNSGTLSATNVIPGTSSNFGALGVSVGAMRTSIGTAIGSSGTTGGTPPTSQTTSRTTSRSSSLCEDDPDWEEDTESDPEQE